MSRAARTSSSKLKATARYGQTQAGAPLVRFPSASFQYGCRLRKAQMRRSAAEAGGSPPSSCQHRLRITILTAQLHSTHALHCTALHCIAGAGAGRVGQELGRSGAFCEQQGSEGTSSSTKAAAIEVKPRCGCLAAARTDA